MTIHQLPLETRTLHGDYDMHREPVLHIESGDTVESAALDAGWGIESPRLDGSPRQRHERFATLSQKGHALTGPIYIEGAKPGMTLCVHFEKLIPGDFGYTYAGGFSHRVHEALGFVENGEDLMLWSLNAEEMTGTNQFGHQIALKPFLGNFGMPPPQAGSHSTSPPRLWGGNFDCKDLVAGTRMYLPVSVEGGLFSFGDGHAAQGHGEVSVTALECPMDEVRLRFELLPDLLLEDSPRAWTPDGWLTFGFDEDLEKATFKALDSMLTLMLTELDLSSRKQALALASSIVDLHVTQIANPAMGVHAFLPHNALR